MFVLGLCVLCRIFFLCVSVSNLVYSAKRGYGLKRDLLKIDPEHNKYGELRMDSC